MFVLKTMKYLQKDPKRVARSLAKKLPTVINADGDTILARLERVIAKLQVKPFIDLSIAGMFY